MAATVLSGTGSVTYTNTTGQNVRVVINYCGLQSLASGINMSWTGDNGNVALSMPLTAFGRNIGYIQSSANVSNNAYISPTIASQPGYGFPTEIMLSNSRSFSLSPVNAGATLSYNIVIIPENG